MCANARGKKAHVGDGASRCGFARRSRGRQLMTNRQLGLWKHPQHESKWF